MTPQEIYSQFFEPDKTVLHIGCNNFSLEKIYNAKEYVRIGLDNLDLDKLPDGFDYVVLDEILELIENPVELIETTKDLGKKVVIYEFKYDEDCVVKENWKTPWKNQGLDFILSRNFDFINDIFLGYATIHICSEPYYPEREDINAN